MECLQQNFGPLYKKAPVLILKWRVKRFELIDCHNEYLQHHKFNDNHYQMDERPYQDYHTVQGKIFRVFPVFLALSMF